MYRLAFPDFYLRNSPCAGSQSQLVPPHRLHVSFAGADKNQRGDEIVVQLRLIVQGFKKRPHFFGVEEAIAGLFRKTADAAGRICVDVIVVDAEGEYPRQQR